MQRTHNSYYVGSSPMGGTMSIIQVPCWTGSRHHLINKDGDVVCKTDSLIVVQQWCKQYKIEDFA